MVLSPLFKLMSEKQASDMFFTAGSPIQIKIQGEVMPINTQVLDAPTVQKMAYECMTPEQIQTFESDLEINFSLIESGVGILNLQGRGPAVRFGVREVLRRERHDGVPVFRQPGILHHHQDLEVAGIVDGTVHRSGGEPQHHSRLQRRGGEAVRVQRLQPA